MESSFTTRSGYPPWLTRMTHPTMTTECQHESVLSDPFVSSKRCVWYYCVDCGRRGFRIVKQLGALAEMRWTEDFGRPPERESLLWESKFFKRRRSIFHRRYDG